MDSVGTRDSYRRASLPQTPQRLEAESNTHPTCRKEAAIVFQADCRRWAFRGSRLWVLPSAAPPFHKNTGHPCAEGSFCCKDGRMGPTAPFPRRQGAPSPVRSGRPRSVLTTAQTWKERACRRGCPFHILQGLQRSLRPRVRDTRARAASGALRAPRTTSSVLVVRGVARSAPHSPP